MQLHYIFGLFRVLFSFMILNRLRSVELSRAVLSPVSIQTQSLALRALRKRKPQETQALEIFTQQTQAPANRNALSKQWQP